MTVVEHVEPLKCSLYLEMSVILIHKPPANVLTSSVSNPVCVPSEDSVLKPVKIDSK